MQPLGILGAGSWGTALAVTAARGGRPVRLCARDPQQVAAMRARRENMARLPGVTLPPEIAPTTEPTALLDCAAVLLAVPAQALRGALPPLAAVTAPLVICAKGIERGTAALLSEVVRAVCPQAPVAALSGPSFAAEVARGLPTALTVAAEDLALAQQLAGLLAQRTFRPYPSDDLVGVEIAGALKNVVAVAAGVVMGTGLGENARAALVTRGLAEIGRLAEARGGRRETMLGLAGLGDLFLTATSLTSRNTAFGHDLGRGATVAELTAAGRPLAEGAWTAAPACSLAARAGVELPITQAVRAVIAGERAVMAAIDELLDRPLRPSED